MCACCLSKGECRGQSSIKTLPEMPTWPVSRYFIGKAYPPPSWGAAPTFPPTLTTPGTAATPNLGTPKSRVPNMGATHGHLPRYTGPSPRRGGKGYSGRPPLAKHLVGRKQTMGLKPASRLPDNHQPMAPINDEAPSDPNLTTLQPRRQTNTPLVAATPPFPNPQSRSQ